MKKYLYLITALAFSLSFTGCAGFSGNGSQVTGSGTIEAEEFQIAAEFGGKIQAVSFEEGQSVRSGEILFVLEKDLLQAQYDESQAAEKSAQANLDAAQANLEAVQTQYDAILKASRELDQEDREDQWQQDQSAEIDLPVWYFSKEERIQAAGEDVQASYDGYQSELKHLQEILDEEKSSNLLEIEKKLAVAHIAYENARTTLNRTRNAHDNDDLLDAAQDQFDTADSTLDNLQSEYDALFSSEEYDDVLRARADVNAARERYEVAQDSLAELRSGDQSLEVASAAAAVSLAEAQVKQAQASLEQAAAASRTIQVQLDKSSVSSPTDGLVLYRNIEAGETVTAGETVMTIANLQEVDLIVYVPEEYYGQIQLGQGVTISSDSYPKETFEGKVANIANEAEFTPRNVQTAEGRKSTVYAIRIKILNADLKLKAGMPVDAVFQ